MLKEILTVEQTAQEKKMVWMEQAIQGGALSKRPFHTNQKQWEKQQDIGITYTFGDVTFGDLGRIHESTRKNKRENMRQLNKKFVINLWKNSSPALQAEYPLGEIPFAKPLTQKSRERISEAQGGLSIRIKEVTLGTEEKKGTTDPAKIASELNIPLAQVLTGKSVLKGWGINLDELNYPYDDLVEKVKNENDDIKLQEFLDSLSTNRLRYTMQRDSEHKILTTVFVVVREKGFRFHKRPVRYAAEKIKTAGIPVKQIVRLGKNGKMHCFSYIVYTKHADRIAEALRNDPDLQRFR